MLERIFLRKFIDLYLKSGGIFKHAKVSAPGLEWVNILHFSHPSANNDYYGLSADSNLKESYIKAFVEFIERKSFIEKAQYNGFSSTSGIAAHRFKILAEKNAMNELYERDSFLLHWYSKTPFIKIDEVPKTIIQSAKILNFEGVAVLFFHTFLGSQKTVCCFLINKNTGGFALGLSSGKGLERDIYKAFFEAIVCFYLGNQGLNSDELLLDLKNEGLSSLKNHRTYWLHLKTIPEWVLNPIKADIQCVNKEIQINFKTNHSQQIGPLCIIGLQSSEILSLNIGKPTNFEYELLLKRLSFDKLPPNYEDLLPHPIP